MLPMDGARSREITDLLKAWGAGDQTALDRLAPAIDQELRRLAKGYLKREPADQTLQTTSLINEAYLRLIEIRDVLWQDRAHFFAISAQIMRRILVDAARSRRAEKRGGRLPHVPLEEAMIAETVPLLSGNDLQILALNDALDSLAKIDPRKVSVIELRFFSGLSVEETAEVLKISPQSVMRDWKLAKSWLARELAHEAKP
jgi:RNA polymerase sigma factor (TIGR02999 family)